MMKTLVKIAVFCGLFVAFLIWRFPYDALIEKSVRRAETVTGATILYQPVSASITGVKVKDLQVTMPSGVRLRFDSAKLFPTRGGLSVSAQQGEGTMEAELSPSTLTVELQDITARTGSQMAETAALTGDVTYELASREGKGKMRIVVPKLQVFLPIPLDSVDVGSTFVINNVGTAEAPRAGLRAEVKLLSGDNQSSANGTVSLERQPPPSAPLINGNFRYEIPNSRGTLRLSGTWDKPVPTIIPN